MLFSLQFHSEMIKLQRKQDKSNTIMGESNFFPNLIKNVKRNKRVNINISYIYLNMFGYKHCRVSFFKTRHNLSDIMTYPN